MDKSATLREIAELIEMQETAIENHPPTTISIYKQGKAAFFSGAGGVNADEELRALSLTAEDLNLMVRYMLSSSFISAWYHLNGQSENRDKTAHSCCTLIAGLGPDSQKTMKQYLGYEHLWRKHLGRNKVSSSSCAGSLALIAVVAAGLIWFGIRVVA